MIGIEIKLPIVRISNVIVNKGINVEIYLKYFGLLLY